MENVSHIAQFIRQPDGSYTLWCGLAVNKPGAEKIELVSYDDWALDNQMETPAQKRLP